VVKTAPATVTSGANMTYNITVHNGGPDPAAAVIVNDPIPSGTTFVSASAPCTGPAVGSNGTVTCSLGTLASGATVPLAITVNVNASAGSTLSNTAIVSSSTTDPNPANNFSTASTNVNGVTPTPSTPTLTPTVTPTPVFADLALTKSGSPNPVFTGKTLTYTIVVNNNGPNPADTVEMSDPLPSQTTLASAPTTTLGSCTAPAVGGTGTVRCELGTMAPSSSATVTIVVTVNAAGGSSVTNTATVTANTADPNLSNNSQTITTSVSP
jgi:uncharacterized repeat protein (TIGR01451 family)